MINSQYGMMNYQVVVINEVPTDFSECCYIKGCVLHFEQGVWRNVVTLGLKQTFNDND